jgi:Trk-type K+ transport system membrane component
MWIGASPASTGGGIKTSKFALAVANIVNLLKGRRTALFGREVSQLSMSRAFAIIILSLFVIGASSFAIMMIEPAQGLLNIAFEVVSAYGTVGLSRGITGSLTDGSKLILIITMFLGRVTMLTFLTAFFKKVSGIYFRFPEEDILIN